MYVVILDGMAILLLLLAAMPEGFVRNRLGSNGAVRYRPSVAAAGLSLLSVSFILVLLGLAAPLP